MFSELLKLLVENYFIPIYGVALILAIIRYRSYFNTVLKYFPIIIAYTFFNELLGLSIKYIDDFQFVSIERYSYYNLILFNIFHFIFFLFFYYVYWNSIEHRIHKKIIKLGSYVFISVNIISLLFQDPMLVYLYYAYALGAILLIVAIIFYFKKIFFEKSNPRKHYHNLLFWVSSGLFIFYLIDPAIMVIGIKNEYLYNKYNLHSLLYKLITVMYLFFITGFIISKRPAFR